MGSLMHVLSVLVHALYMYIYTVHVLFKVMACTFGHSDIIVVTCLCY